MALNVVISDLLKPIHVGDEIVPIYPHPIIQWIERKLGLNNWPMMYVSGEKIETNQIIQWADTIVMPSSVYADLERYINLAERRISNEFSSIKWYAP